MLNFLFTLLLSCAASIVIIVIIVIAGALFGFGVENTCENPDCENCPFPRCNRREDK